MKNAHTERMPHSIRISRKRRHHEGFTLVEAVVGVLLVAVLATAVTLSVSMSRQMTYATAQRVESFGLCRSQLETLRGMGYEQVSTNVFLPETGLRMGHLSGQEQVELTATRTVRVTPLTAPDRQEVAIRVVWQFRGQILQENLTGWIYQ